MQRPLFSVKHLRKAKDHGSGSSTAPYTSTVLNTALKLDECLHSPANTGQIRETRPFIKIFQIYGITPAVLFCLLRHNFKFIVLKLLQQPLLVMVDYEKTDSKISISISHVNDGSVSAPDFDHG